MSGLIPDLDKHHGDIKKRDEKISSFDSNQIRVNQYLEPIFNHVSTKKPEHISDALHNQVEKNSAVLIHFTLKLEDGSIAESSRVLGKPALFRLGDHSLSSLLEAQLLGLKVGDKKNFQLPPCGAFGEKKSELLQSFSKRAFSNIGSPQVGAVIVFTSVNGHEMPGIVDEVIENSVTVNFNHPLAGRSVSFDVEVLKIYPQDGEKNENIAG